MYDVVRCHVTCVMCCKVLKYPDITCVCMCVFVRVCARMNGRMRLCFHPYDTCLYLSSRYALSSRVHNFSRVALIYLSTDIQHELNFKGCYNTTDPI